MKHVTDLSEQPCNKSDKFDKVVTSCQQVVPNLLATDDKQCEYILLTACWQTCYKMGDFYVCSTCLFHVHVYVASTRRACTVLHFSLITAGLFHGSQVTGRGSQIYEYINTRYVEFIVTTGYV